MSELLSTKQAVALIRKLGADMTEQQLRRMAKAGTFPAIKQGSHWRFEKGEIVLWAILAYKFQSWTELDVKLEPDSECFSELTVAIAIFVAALGIAVALVYAV